ncbi:bifunctional ADP-dependent NAD(P)H-hydrate dehydratase/NAD(P)H-hydrate epimerase [Natranaerobius thermophilus]|uniref:Bifunctional NAD(P)H-hydrate repair enzyme n=1 Tax=Natranaerobius thermophilus (strain ATCC BAA-1301 / DSM 18059 / JW/NM-WN-LF) TaxID=457570 RepID=B2A4Y0_NATTJ|nr:bifunctional ADP-dependent NAD(P)H-hydrate dehydratase/NAD(P)H-hydrate epimerase [Natranaerobius thermophilus]ACB83902.1 carbohydrate kinase, YjeF related protein [Natranaerobius thermophilus JW/NM-WN-LF]
MLKVVSPEEMAQIDKMAIDEGRIPGIVLMENAATAVTNVVLNFLNNMKADYNQTQVTVLAGIGNNGGDGFAVARQLAMKEINVSLVLIGKADKLSGDALTNWEIIKHRDDIKIHTIDQRSTDNLTSLNNLIIESDIILDALLGTGLAGAPKEPFNTCIQIANQSRRKDCLTISVDIPSGVSGSGGEVDGNAVMADITVTFAQPKTGLLFYPGAHFTGELLTVPIGIPNWIVTKNESQNYLVTEGSAANLLPQRLPDTHKGHYGRVTIIAGSSHMLGAGVLVSMAAVKSGSGLVTWAVPESEERTAQSKVGSEVMTWCLPSKDGVLAQQVHEKLEKTVTGLEHGPDVMAVGPGLGTEKGTEEVVKKALLDFNTSLVLDADGLNVLVGNTNWLSSSATPKVLTPHIGEYSRLIDKSIDEIKSNPINLVTQSAQEWNSVIVLKGTPTIIASPHGSSYIVSTSNSGMATGGSGDVLTGIITSLIGQGLTVEEGAILGVYLHKIAGEKARSQSGEASMTATDLWNSLPDAFQYLNDKS